MTVTYIFDPETGNLVPSKTEGGQIAAQDQTTMIGIVPLPPETDSLMLGGTPGGTGTDQLQPPETFYVSSSVVRNNPDGSTSVDVVITVDDGTTRQYDIRVTKV